MGAVTAKREDLRVDVGSVGVSPADAPAGGGSAAGAGSVDSSTDDSGVVESSDFVRPCPEYVPVCRPPVATTMPGRGSNFDVLPPREDGARSIVDAPVVDGVVSIVDVVVSVVAVAGPVVVVVVSVVVVSAVVAVVPVSPSAHATPDMLATAAPIPNATANAPTRPMYCAAISTDAAVDDRRTNDRGPPMLNMVVPTLPSVACRPF